MNLLGGFARRETLTWREAMPFDSGRTRSGTDVSGTGDFGFRLHRVMEKRKENYHVTLLVHMICQCEIIL